MSDGDKVHHLVNWDVLGEDLDRELWYVIIAVLSVLIILTLLVGCFILGRKREKSNAELIKNANER